MTDISKDYTGMYLESLLSGNRKKASEITHEYLDLGNDLMALYNNIMKPALYEVGRLWETNMITVADEHLATAITEGILNELYSRVVPDDYNGKKVVLACTENEEHQVGIKMVADIFELNGWESFFLGTGFPTSELLKYMEHVKPDIVAVSLSVYFNFKSFKKMVTSIREKFPDLKIVAGGQAFQHISKNPLEELKGITYISELEELKNFIINLN